VALPGGRKLYLSCRGEGAPTVIFEAGLHNRGDVWSAPAEPGLPTVLPAVARMTRVCAYDRPGTTLGTNLFSRSDAVRMPRSTGSAVADLRALLRAARVPGPYVLVGHSTGGMIVRQFASTFPRRVAGLALVDAIPETMAGDLSVHNWNAYNAGYLTAAPPEYAGYADLETIDFRASFAQIRRVGTRPPRRIPLIVLSKGQSFGIPDPLGPLVDRAWVAGQRYLAHLQPRTPHLVARNSGHYIMVMDPGLVIRSVERVVRAVRRGRHVLG
jgi:pimeloyl-ACP methyl ester carboxylesterase